MVARLVPDLDDLVAGPPRRLDDRREAPTMEGERGE
jgi:hypothetical protein